MDAVADAAQAGASRRRAADSAFVGIGVVVLGAIGAGQALIILFLVGTSPSTDAFFAAYSIYVPIATLGQALRTTLVPLLGGRHLRHDRDLAGPVLGRALVLAGTSTAILLVASPLLAMWLTSGHRSVTGVAWAVLAVLAVAAGLQVLAGSLAAALNALDQFRRSVTFYVGTSLLSLGLSVALTPAFGVVGAAVGLAIGAGVNSALHALNARKYGLHMQARVRWAVSRAQMRFTAVLVAGLALTGARQVVLAVALASLSATAGASTVYSYAYYISGLFLNIAVVPLAIVTVPGLVEQIKLGSRRAAETYILATTPYMLAVLLPGVGAFLAFGGPIIHAVFGSSMSARNLASMDDTSAWLAAGTLPTAVFALTSGVLISARRWHAAVVVSVATMALHTIGFAVVGRGEPEATAVVQVAATTLCTGGLLAAVYGGQALGLTARMGVLCSPGLVLCAIFPLLALVAGQPRTPLPALAMSVIGTALYFGLALWLWPPLRSLRARLRKPGQRLAPTPTPP